MKASFLVLYRQLVLIISCCLLVTALTGIIVGLNNRLIQLPDPIVEILVDLHQGAFLGDKLVSIYVLLLGLGVFSLGLKIVVNKRDSRLFGSIAPIVADACRIIGLVLVIPLAVCVETGLAYRLGTDWLGMSGSETTGFLSVHGGDFFAKPFDIIYLLAIGIGLITLLILNQSFPTFRGRKSNKTARKHHQVVSQQQSETTLLRNATTKKNGIFANKKIKLTIAIVCGAIALLVLYYFTSALLVTIAVMVIVIILSAIVLGKSLIRNWQQPKQASTILQEQEAQSTTMLKAIPDSMLRISQNGTCLSYMPAQKVTSFKLYGDIVNKNINEFLAPKIAQQFTTLIRSSLQTGSTNICRFSISDKGEEQYFEARVNPIGDIEALILVRQIDNSNLSSIGSQHFVPTQGTEVIKILTELEFTQVLEMKLLDINQRNYILLCLATYAETKDTDVFSIDNSNEVTINADLIFQIATQIHSLIPSSIVASLDENDLIVLVSDRTMETASIVVDDLSQKIDELLLSWQNDLYSIKFKIALLEINSDSSDARASIDAAKTACQMAKQKINLKTF